MISRIASAINLPSKANENSGTSVNASLVKIGPGPRQLLQGEAQKVRSIF